ncbi:purine and uridine phosphorylase, partial [Rhizodiscina lignyota]
MSLQQERVPISAEAYQIGWVSALPLELEAAKRMLDEEHENKIPQSRHDHNVYTLGRIGPHNVVLVCLPSGRMGTNSAAAVGRDMISTFPALRFILMVGIGGGVPSEMADVRLGDVVVGRPQQGYGGVVQYDFGKARPDRFEHTGHLNAPPSILLSAISKLQADKTNTTNEFAKYLSPSIHTRDEAGPDLLFEASYNHENVEEDHCESCSTQRLVKRNERRVGEKTIIHYGLIASGNEVMRSGVERDRINKEFHGGVLCFEMEAAGLMNNFPCLVVRGICDYSDSHKTKNWQKFAAATAAAHATRLLLLVPPADISSVRTIAE